MNFVFSSFEQADFPCLSWLIQAGHLLLLIKYFSSISVVRDDSLRFFLLSWPPGKNELVCFPSDFKTGDAEPIKYHKLQYLSIFESR